MIDRPVRIGPLPPADWSEATRLALDGLVGVGGNPRPVHLPAVIARHPTYLAPYLGWAKAVALHGVLSSRHNELIALRTAYLCRSAFEWGVHGEYARRPGCLSEDEVAAVAAGRDADRWSPTERALLVAADELHHHAAVVRRDLGRPREGVRRRRPAGDRVRGRPHHDAVDGHEQRRRPTRGDVATAPALTRSGGVARRGASVRSRPAGRSDGRDAGRAATPVGPAEDE